MSWPKAACTSPWRESRSTRRLSTPLGGPSPTCAGQAEKQLKRTQLSGPYAVYRLPDLDFARSYPTLGPSGLELVTRSRESGLVGRDRYDD